VPMTRSRPLLVVSADGPPTRFLTAVSMYGAAFATVLGALTLTSVADGRRPGAVTAALVHRVRPVPVPSSIAGRASRMSRASSSPRGPARGWGRSVAGCSPPTSDAATRSPSGCRPPLTCCSRSTRPSWSWQPRCSLPVPARRHLPLQEQLLELTPASVRDRAQGAESAGWLTWQGLGAAIVGGVAQYLPEPRSPPSPQSPLPSPSWPEPGPGPGVLPLPPSYSEVGGAGTGFVYDPCIATAARWHPERAPLAFGQVDGAVFPSWLPCSAGMPLLSWGGRRQLPGTVRQYLPAQRRDRVLYAAVGLSQCLLTPHFGTWRFGTWRFGTWRFATSRSAQRRPGVAGRRGRQQGSAARAMRWFGGLRPISRARWRKPGEQWLVMPESILLTSTGHLL
jgi:hypothetical protein